MFFQKNNSNLINLLPAKILEERNFNKIKKALLFASIIPLGMYLVSYAQLNSAKGDLDEVNNQIVDLNSLENEIKLLEKDVFNNTRILNGLSSEQLPLHHFLLEVGLIVPTDMHLYSITTGNIEKMLEETELVEENDKQTADDTDSEVDESNLGGGTTIETTKEDGTEKTEAEIEAELQKIEDEKITLQKTMYIRGAVTSVDSLGVFMSRLEENTYIAKVDMQNIQNYYNGAQSYKIFELIVSLK